MQQENEMTMILDGKPVVFVRKDSIPAQVVITAESGPYQIGKAYHIRTVTMAIHGTIVAVTPGEIVLRDAAWIADSGRFADYASGKIDPSEIEPFPGDVIVGRGAVVDAFQRPGSFRSQK